MNLRIPDAVYEAYARRNPEDPRLELERSLQAFAELDPRRVSLFFNQEELAEIGSILGIPVQDTKTFLEALRRSQRATFGEGLEVDLNPGQRNRLRQMADFYKRPSDDPAKNFKEYAEAQLKRGVVTVVGP